MALSLDDLIGIMDPLFGRPGRKPTATEVVEMGHLGNEIYNDVVSEMMPPWKELAESQLVAFEKDIGDTVVGDLVGRLCNQLRFYRRLTERLLPYANTLRIEEQQCYVFVIANLCCFVA